MSQRTLWEEGHEPGRQVVVLGVAVALTVTTIDLLAFERLTALFDVGFVLLCLALALLPPLLMVAVVTLLATTRPLVVADPGDGLVQAVVSGLSHHAGALVLGYLLSLAVLAVRHRVVQAASNRLGSPAPTRTTSG